MTVYFYTLMELFRRRKQENETESTIRRKFLYLLIFIAVLFPAGAFGAASGIGAEYELAAVGLGELIWRVTSDAERNTGSQTTDYSLGGRIYPGSAVGLSVFRIFNSNIYLGLSGQYRDFPANFQTPAGGDNENLRLSEQLLLFRMGYIDYFYDSKWTVGDFGDALKAHPFGQARLGIIRSTLTQSDPLEDFDPAVCGLFGFELGSLFLPYTHGYFHLSAYVDYTFTVAPYKSDGAGSSQEILLNILYFGLSAQFGYVSENPE